MAKTNKVRAVVLAVAVSWTAASGTARADGDAAHGKQVFRKCAACHSLEVGKNKIGPPLHGVIGRKSGSVKGFRYSRAMQNADVVWRPETLDRYLAAPKKFIPGNRMPFPGIRNDKDRADLIAYLRQIAVGN